MGHESEAAVAAFNAFQDALTEWLHHKTPAAHTALEHAHRQAIESVGPLIGHALTMQWRASYEATLSAVGRTRLLAARPLEDTDDALVQPLLDEVRGRLERLPPGDGSGHVRPRRAPERRRVI
jgi:hypothetical protein